MKFIKAAKTICDTLSDEQKTMLPHTIELLKTITSDWQGAKWLHNINFSNKQGAPETLAELLELYRKMVYAST